MVLTEDRKTDHVVEENLKILRLSDMTDQSFYSWTMFNSSNKFERQSSFENHASVNPVIVKELSATGIIPGAGAL